MVLEYELREVKKEQEVFESFESGYKRIEKEIIKNLGLEPKVYAVAGGSGSGKTKLAKRLASLDSRILYITMDDFFTVPVLRGNEKDYDDPESYQLEKVNLCLYGLKRGREVIKPVYKKEDNSHKKENKRLQAGGAVVLDGLFALNQAVIAEVDLKIFVDADSELRLLRRIKRDSHFQSIQDVKAKWKFAEEAFVRYIAETRKAADILIKDNTTSI